MIAIVMAGGFAKRLWPLTKNQPKPLLDVAGRPILEYVLKKVEAVPEVEKIIVSTNEKWGENFKEFIASRGNKKEAEVFVEPGLKNDEKLGALGGLGYLIEHKGIQKDLMVVGGDNIFEFDLNRLVALFKEKKATVIAFHDCQSIEVAKKMGVAELGEDGKIIDFEEKPAEPKSTFVSTACYVFPKKSLKLLFEYLKENSPDALGFFVKWLYQREPVYGMAFKEEWFDIGSFEQLEEARKYFGAKG